MNVYDIFHEKALRNGFNSTSIRRAMMGPQLILFAESRISSLQVQRGQLEYA